MENLLIEGRYDKVTSELSNEIVQAIKSGKKSVKTRIRLFTRTFVDINIYFKYTDDEGAQIYGATYLQPKQLRTHFKNKRIVLHVIAPKDPRNRVLELNTFIPEIKNIVRHEIEHVLQFYLKDRERKGFFSSKRGYPEHLEYWEYMTEPYEVEAYNRGLYKKAKTLRQPLNVLFDKWWEYLESIELNPDEINVIKKAWTDYAKKHLYQSPTRQYGYRDENTMGAGVERNINEPVVQVQGEVVEEARTVGFKYKKPGINVVINFDAPDSGNIKFKIMDILDNMDVEYNSVRGGGGNFNSYSLDLNLYDENEIDTIINDLNLKLMLDGVRIGSTNYNIKNNS